MLKNIFTNSFGILFSRILGFLRDLLMASYLGANIYSDIFFIAFKLPNLFRRIFAEGAFSQTFIPAFARSKHKGVFALTIVWHFVLIVLLLSFLVQIFPAQATALIAFGFGSETIELATPFVAINFWYLIFIFLVTFLAGLLQYRHHFATTAFSTAMLNISLIVALLLAQEKSQKEMVYYLSYGVVVGGMLQLVLHVIAIKKMKLCKLLVGAVQHFGTKKTEVKEEVKSFKREFLPAIWGNSTAQFSAFLDTWLASFLAVGSISYLYYANRVFQLPLALFAIATSVAIFPRVSRFLKNNDELKAKQYMRKAFWFLLYLLSFSTTVGVLFSQEIVWLLFERGAFGANESAKTALVLQMYLVGLLPFGLQKLFSLWLYASLEQKKAAKIATYLLGFNIVLSCLFIAPLGAVGLALASSLSGFVGFFLTVKFFGFKEFFGFFTKKQTFILVGSVVVLAIILLYIQPLLHHYM